MLWPASDWSAKLVATATILPRPDWPAQPGLEGNFGDGATHRPARGNGLPAQSLAARFVPLRAVPPEPAGGRGQQRAVGRVPGALRARYSRMAGAGDARIPQRSLQRAIYFRLHAHP